MMDHMGIQDGHQASRTAYMLSDLIRVTLVAFENDNINIEIEKRGIDGTLRLAVDLACELIDQIETLEMNLPDDLVRRETA